MSQGNPDGTRRGVRRWLRRVMSRVKMHTHNAESGHAYWTGEFDDQCLPVVRVTDRPHRVRRVTYLAYWGRVYWDETVITTCGDLECIRAEHLDKTVKGSPASRYGGYIWVTCFRCGDRWLSDDPAVRACPGDITRNYYGCADRHRKEVIGAETQLEYADLRHVRRKCEEIQQRVRNRTRDPEVPKKKRSLGELCREVGEKLKRQEGEGETDVEQSDPGSAGDADDGGAEGQKQCAGRGGPGAGPEARREAAVVA